MKYKLNDVVLLRVKIVGVNELGTGIDYRATSGRGDKWNVSEESILGLAPVEIPDGWRELSDTPNTNTVVKLLAKDLTTTKVGKMGSEWIALPLGHKEYPARVSELITAFVHGSREDIADQYIAWQPITSAWVNEDGSPAKDPNAPDLPPGWKPASEPPDDLMIVPCLTAKHKQRDGWYQHSDSNIVHKQGWHLLRDCESGKCRVATNVIGWKEKEG